MVARARTDPCRIDQLAIGVISHGAHSYVPVHSGVGYSLTFTNTSQRTCTLRGWPRVEALNLRRTPLPYHVEYATIAQFGYVGVTAVALSPHTTAVSWLETTRGAAPVPGCNLAARWLLRVTPPANTASVTFQQPTSHPEPCRGATLVVSPVHPQAVPLYSGYPPPGVARSPCQARALRLHLQSEGANTELGIWLAVDNTGTACGANATVLLTLERNGATLRIRGIPVRRQSHWALPRGRRYLFHAWWANWCGPRTGVRVSATFGQITAIEPLRMLPVCLQPSRPSSVQVISGE